MKLKMLVSAVLGIAALAVMTGCTSVNTSDAGSMNIYPQVVGPVDAYRPQYKVDEKTKVNGSAKVNVLFGIFAWGDTSTFADNASIFEENALLSFFFFWLPNAQNIAAKSAFYNACKEAKCDAVVASRYEIVTDDYWLFKRFNVKITGFPATLVGVETVKPMPYYIDCKGQVVVLEKFVMPYRLFNAYKPATPEALNAFRWFF